MGGQDQNVNIIVNKGPNNTQNEINTGRESHKLKTKKTNKHRSMKMTRLTGQGKGTRNRLDRRNRKWETGNLTK